MAEPLFLTLEEVLQLHAYQITEFGGSEEILDKGLLESAIAQPSQKLWGQVSSSDIRGDGGCLPVSYR